MIKSLRRTSDRSSKTIVEVGVIATLTHRNDRSSLKEHMENALASGAEEGRDKLR